MSRWSEQDDDDNDTIWDRYAMPCTKRTEKIMDTPKPTLDPRTKAAFQALGTLAAMYRHGAIPAYMHDQVYEILAAADLLPVPDDAERVRINSENGHHG